MNKRELVGRVPPGRVEEQVALTERLAPNPRQVGDRGVREDERDVRKGASEIERVRTQRRNPLAGVDDDRQAQLLGERKDLLDGPVAQAKPLGARMQLDARRAPADRTPDFLEAAGVRIDPTERDELAFRLLGRREDAVIGCGVGTWRCEREHDAPGVDDVERCSQLVGSEARAVRIGASQMRVAVANPDARQSPPQTRKPRLH